MSEWDKLWKCYHGFWFKHPDVEDKDNWLNRVKAVGDKLLDDNRKLEDGTTRLGRLIYNKTIEATELSDKLEAIHNWIEMEAYSKALRFDLIKKEVLGE